VRRREFITLLGGATAAWPFAARAQQPSPVIGYLNGGFPDLDADRERAFRQGLAEVGYVVGRNVAVEYRWGEGHNDRLPAMAADLVRRQVTVIAAGGNAAALAGKAATSSIPIVFSSGGDPVQLGLVTRMNRPDGNLTGVSNLNAELTPKRLELLHELLLTVRVIALLVNPANPVTQALVRETEAAARTLGLQLQILSASSEDDFESAFRAIGQSKAGGLVIGADQFFNNWRTRLAQLSAQQSVPAIYQFREFAEAGGLMSYGGNLTDASHLAGVYTGRILKGEKPADLPVQQYTKVELIINMKAAKALGLTFPLTLLGRADGVIE
jgi:putative ABC transport system substrate-binding protein